MGKFSLPILLSCIITRFEAQEKEDKVINKFSNGEYIVIEGK